MEIVEYRREGDIGFVTMNRPERLNARSDALEAALKTSWSQFESDVDAKVAIFSGRGKAFCAGMDLKERPNRKAVTGQQLRSAGGIYEVTKPVVAAIHGYCLGGGLTMTMWADVRIAANSTVFGFPEIRHGIHPNTPYFINQGIPICVISELALAAQNFSAQRAQQVGLINTVVDDDVLMQEAELAAKKMAAFPLEVLRMGKQLLRKSIALPDAIWEATAQHRAHTYSSKDEAEGVAAFQQKRQPKWQ